MKAIRGAIRNVVFHPNLAESAGSRAFAVTDARDKLTLRCWKDNLLRDATLFEPPALKFD